MVDNQLKQVCRVIPPADSCPKAAQILGIDRKTLRAKLQRDD